MVVGIAHFMDACSRGILNLQKPPLRGFYKITEPQPGWDIWKLLVFILWQNFRMKVHNSYFKSYFCRIPIIWFLLRVFNKKLFCKLRSNTLKMLIFSKEPATLLKLNVAFFKDLRHNFQEIHFQKNKIIFSNYLESYF